MVVLSVLHIYRHTEKEQALKQASVVKAEAWADLVKVWRLHLLMIKLRIPPVLETVIETKTLFSSN